MNKKNLRLRKRIIRVFKDAGKNKLSTAEIMDRLSNQRTADGLKRYLTHPSITKISNLLKYHKEFKRCKEDTYITYGSGGGFNMATWELTNEGRRLLEW